MTTSEGRYYRRTQFKRLVQKVEKEYRAQGKHVNTAKIQRNMLEKSVSELITESNVTKN